MKAGGRAGGREGEAERHGGKSQHLQFGRVIIPETNNENNFSGGCEVVLGREGGRVRV